MLEAAIVADRLRGASWLAVGNALDVSADAARERFSSAERRFREALLFPRQHPEKGGLGYAMAPNAAEEPERGQEQLDAWIVWHRWSKRAGSRRAGTGHPRIGCDGRHLDRRADRPGARALGGS